MTATTNKRVIIHGAGPSVAQNTQDLLNDFFGFPKNLDTDESDIFVYHNGNKVPSGLSTVLDWIDDLELVYNVKDLSGDLAAVKEAHPYAESIDEVDGKDPLDYLASSPESSTLIVLWDDADAFTRDLVKQAQEAGIRVLDLSAGLDELKLAPAPPEPISLPDDKPKRGRPRKTPEPVAEKPVEETEEELPAEEPAKPAARRTASSKAASKSATTTTDDPPWDTEDPAEVSRAQTSITAGVAPRFFEINNKILAIIEEIKELPTDPAIQNSVYRLKEASFWLGQHFVDTGGVTLQ